MKKQLFLFAFVFFMIVCFFNHSFAEEYIENHYLITNTDLKLEFDDLSCIRDNGTSVHILSDLSEWYILSAVDLSQLYYDDLNKAADIIFRQLEERIIPGRIIENSGIYAGDLFDYSSECKSYSLTISDMLLAAYLAEPEYKKTYSESHHMEYIRNAVSLLALQHPDLKFNISLFGDIRCLSITAYEKEECLLTFSYKSSGENTIEAVMGFSQNGKTYYTDILINIQKDRKIIAEGRLLADDKGLGYRSATDKWIVFSYKAEVEIKDSIESVFHAEIFPANQSLSSISYSGKAKYHQAFLSEIVCDFFYEKINDPVLSVALTRKKAENSQSFSAGRKEFNINIDSSSQENGSQFICDYQRMMQDYQVTLFCMLPPEIAYLLLK